MIDLRLVPLAQVAHAWVSDPPSFLRFGGRSPPSAAEGEGARWLARYLDVPLARATRSQPNRRRVGLRPTRGLNTGWPSA